MKKSELFDLYLQDKLNEDQLKEFKTRLNEEADFNRDFQHIKEIRFAARHNDRLEVRQLLDGFEGQLNHEDKYSRKPFWKSNVAISAVIILALAAIYFFTNPYTLNLKEAFAKHYEAPTIDELIDDSSIDLNSYKSAPILAYQSGNYALAKQSLIEILDSIHAADLYLIGGVSALEAGNTELSVDRLNILLNRFDKYQEQALWFSAMAFLSLEKNTEALCALYTLSEMDFPKYDRLEVLSDIGIKPNRRTSLGIIESIFVATDSLASSEYIPFSQKGILSDLTTRNKYEFHINVPSSSLKEGGIVDYITLEEITDINPIGIAYIKEEQ